MTKKKTEKSCSCTQQVNEQLEQYNTMLVGATLINFETGKLRPSPPEIATEKIDTKGRKPKRRVFASFCPFCGKKYSKEQ